MRIFAIVFTAIVMSKVLDGGSKGKGMAITGLVLGVIDLVYVVVTVILNM